MGEMEELTAIVSRYGLEAILRHIHALVLLIESDGRLVTWNPAFDPLKTAFPGLNNLEEYFPEDERMEFHRRLELVNSSAETTRWEGDLIIDQEGKQVLYDCLMLPAADGRVLFIAEQLAGDPAISDVIEKLNRQVKLFRSESEKAKKIALNKHIEMEAVIAQANEVSHIDPLTFLPNRRQIIKELQDEIQRAERYKSLISISMVDVDHFKNINDTYGHVIGDQVLREIANLLSNHTRHPDMVARYGGEEFLILLPNTGLESASGQAARLCREVRDSPIRVNSRNIQVTISIGVAEYQYGVDTWKTLLSRADTAMYEAKRKGRDRWMAAKV